MSRNIEFSIDEYYHLYNRGTDKRKIFTTSGEYSRFLILLYLCNGSIKVDIGDYLNQGLTLSEIFEVDKGKELVSIGTYCLMPNHFHILIREKEENGTSLFMQKLQTAYTMYFNKKHVRTGSLFQGTFKAQYVTKDTYLKYLFAYINLNPIKLIDPDWKENGIKNLIESEEYLGSYKYSSYLDLIGVKRVEASILNMSEFPDYFNSELKFKDFIQEWLNFKNLDDSDKV
ncbi:transposase [Candidatus Nomurabacteria bacterium]|nr:transposase [Candidatus Nomurabacteria bacterium]